MEIKGWVRSSLVDYPGHIATVLFVGGCEWRCPMCHNPDLVLRPGGLPTVAEDAVLAHLARRAGLIEGVVITGGEPALQPDLRRFLRRLRQAGTKIKLDSNGYHPQVIEALLQENLVDYVAMDVKAPPGKYPVLTGRPEVDPGRIERSLALLQRSGVAYELRTTVVPGLLAAEDVEAIARWIAGAPLYALQQFRPQNTLGPALAQVHPYRPETLREMAGQAAAWVGQVTVRA